MPDRQKSEVLDPYGNYVFALEIGKVQIGLFMECSGLKSVSEVFEIQEGGLNGYTRKRVGQGRWENITLKYATNVSTALLEWRDRWLQDGFAERTDANGFSSGAIILYANDRKTTLRRYEFKNAWPVSWEGPALNGASSELAIETLEIAHDGLTIS